MKESPWGPNDAWKGPVRKPPPQARFQDGNKPACMSVAVPVVVVIGGALWKLCWKLRRR